MRTQLESGRGALNLTGWITGAFILTMSVVAMAGPPAPPGVGGQAPQPEVILARMAEFLSKTPSMSVTLHAAYDALQPDGDKVEWNDIRKVTLSRPDHLRIDTERSDGARSLLLFDGKNITTFDEKSQAYAQAPQKGNVDDTVIHFVRDMGMRLPLAVLLLSRLPQELESRVEKVEYVEKTTTLGVPAHHLVGRTSTVDFQLWIADGDTPLPVRAVLTYKNALAQPQFRAQFSDWDLHANPPDSMFAFTPPSTAFLIPFASAVPQIALGSKAPPVKKGARR